MNTEEYIETLDGDFRFEEMDRLYIHDPVKAILKTAPEELRELESLKIFIEFGIVKHIRPVFFEDNYLEFQSGYDFVYDKKTGLIFSCIQGEHAKLMSSLYAIQNGLDNPDVLDIINTITNQYEANNAVYDILTEFEDFQSWFIEESYGFYMSSTIAKTNAKVVTIGEEYQLTNKEKEALKGFSFDKI